MERPARAAFVGALVAALITLPGLGIGTLWDNSETAYGEVAREVLLTGDWVVMHLNGQAWFTQPPLYFWIAAIFAHLFGVGALAMRLPSALATILMAGMTGYAVARQAGTRVGIYASVILSSCLMQAIIGRLAIMDALLDLTVAMTIFWWFRALETGRDRYFVFGCIAAGFGFLAKGLVAPAIAVLVIGPFAWWNARHEATHLPSRRAWLVGAAAFLVVTLPWPIAVGMRHGLHPMVELIVHYTFGRYTGVIENQAGPVWYYVPVIVLGFFPWIAFLPMSVVYGVRQLLQEGNGDASLRRLLRLGFMWMLVPFVFFSFAETKLPNYIALAFPALALVTALYFEAVARKGGTRSAVISAITVPIGIGALAIAIAIFSRTNRLTPDIAGAVPVLLLVVLAIFLGSFLTALCIGRRTSAALAPYALAVATIVALDTLVLALLARAELYKPVPQLAAIIDRQRRPGDAVAIQSVSGGNALIFYTQPGVKVLAPPGFTDEGGLSPEGVICSSKRVWLIAPTIRPSYDPTYGRDRRSVARAAKATLFLIDGPNCH